jgi:hypothetical protein
MQVKENGEPGPTQKLASPYLDQMAMRFPVEPTGKDLIGLPTFRCRVALGSRSHETGKCYVLKKRTASAF